MSATSHNVESAASAVMESRNPATGEVIGTVPVDGPKDVAAKIAFGAFPGKSW